jgi:hypothetical protein
MSPVVTHLGLIGLAVVGLYLIVDSIRMILSSSTDQPDAHNILTPSAERWIDRYYNGFDMLKAGVGLAVLAAIIFFWLR